MIQDARGNPNPQTPSMDRSLPPEINNEDEVPYGRTHHADRDRAAHSRSEPMAALQRPLEVVKFEEELGLGTPNSRIQTSTPSLKLKSPGGSHRKFIESPGSRELPRPPRGRSESPFHIRMAYPGPEPSDGTTSIPCLDSPSFRSTSGSPSLGTPMHGASPFSKGLESMPSIGSLNGHGNTGSPSRPNPRIGQENFFFFFFFFF